MFNSTSDKFKHLSRYFIQIQSLFKMNVKFKHFSSSVGTFSNKQSNFVFIPRTLL